MASTHHYDTPVEPPDLPSPLNDLMALTDKAFPDWEDLERFWDLVRQCRKRLAHQSGAASLFAIPGPIVRRMVHFLDRVAFRPGAVRRYNAISRNVLTRKDYFPAGVSVGVIHHPSNLVAFQNTAYDYLFTLSRLEGMKRIHWLLEAFLATTIDREFRIAGVGSDEQRLRDMAACDPRVKFLGRITDDEVIRQYAGAMFVPFAPVDEDYGLITIEAMHSGKPVLTCRDSGGVCEFIKNGVTGLSVKPDVRALSEAMALMSDDEPWMREMGQNARAQVEPISWPATIRELLASP